MITKLTVLLILFELQRVCNSPLRLREARHDVPILIHHHTVPTHVIIPHREKKSPAIISIPISQILVPIHKLHVIPAQSNTHHSAIHTDIKHIVTHDNIKIPIISHTVSHSAANITHSQSVLPLLIPVHHNLVPVHDLSVIPLQKNVHKVEHKIEHYRMMEKKEEEPEEVNRFRTFYGGFGNGLFFGGQGAGHGFHVFG